MPCVTGVRFQERLNEEQERVATHKEKMRSNMAIFETETQGYNEQAKKRDGGDIKGAGSLKGSHSRKQKRQFVSHS
jgi:hypothetical protein